MKSILLLVISLFFSLLSIAQSKKQVLEIAKKAYNEQQYTAVIDLLEDYVSAYPNEIESTYLLGAANYEINNYDRAVSLLKQIYNKDRDRNYPKTSYYLAESYQQLGNYRYAKRYYQRALSPYRRQKESFEYLKLNQAIASVEFSSQQKNTTYRFKNIGKDLNTPNADYGFSSISEDEGVFASINEENNRKISRIYLAVKHENGWQKVKALTFDLEDSTTQVANPYYDSENNRLYMSVCDSNRKCDIAYALFDSTKKMRPIIITSIRYPGATNTQPCIATINQISYLIFSSNRPGGLGGLDLWASEINGETYHSPVNLSSHINTPGNEITPYYNNDTLYFSSDWHLSLGGFDIFKTRLTLLEENNSVINFTAVNSSLNDLYFTKYKTELFLTSNRDGAIAANSNYCCNDLFSYLIDTTVTLPKMDSLEYFFPLILYFDNDEPKPSRQANKSAKNYEQLLSEYQNQQENYLKKNRKSISSQDDIEEFFNWQLLKEDQLYSLFCYLFRELNKGDTITLHVRGFSSSLASESYNKTLSDRRINSFIQSLENYKNGVLIAYLKNKQLTINKEALGEITNQSNEEDEDAIYNVNAMLNRKIEIDATRHIKKNHPTHK